MAASLLTVAGQVGTLFLMMAVGFVLAKLGKLKQEALPQLTYLLLYIVAPCVIVNAMQTERDASLMRDLLIGFGVIALTYVIYILITLPLFRRQPEDTRATLRFAAMYGNTGFMGLPLVQAVFGGSALIYASLAFVVFTIFSWTHGMMMMGGRKHFSLKAAIVNPGVLSAIVGLLLFLTGIRLPSVVGNAVGFLADLNTPLAMVVIGAQMESTNLTATFRRGLLYQGTAVKLLLLPLITALVLLPFHLTPLMYCTIVVLSATPSAGVTSMFSIRFGRDSESAAQIITLSTLLSIITLPIFAVIARVLSGTL